MKHLILFCAAIALVAPAAFADDSLSSRDVQAAVDSYLATSGDDAALVGGAGSAGYDAGFWIRGGDFLLRINATLQARFESWDWDDEDAARDEARIPDLQGTFAGDTSGFSLPRATLKFSGEAPCNICWYLELEFGHFGRDVVEEIREDRDTSALGVDGDQPWNFDASREAWIEWCYCPVFNIRMGTVRLPSTRQAMVVPELQQFVDVSLATERTIDKWIGRTDRNRDHGLLIHGAFGCNSEWSYLVSITNGDGGDSIRNVLDHRTSDNLAYGFRLNWAFLAPIGYEEGALRQQTCQWYGEVGAWAGFYADRRDKSHESQRDMTVSGLDLAMGWGGFSLTAAWNYCSSDDDGGQELTQTGWLFQLGYHFPGTAWEIAARADGYSFSDSGDSGAIEYAFGVNYYLNGHGNKLQLDVSVVETQGDHDLFDSVYPGYLDGVADESSAILLRFQWQLAL